MVLGFCPCAPFLTSSSWPIRHVVGSLLSSSSGSGHGISVVFLSASAPLVVSARQAPSAEK